MEEFYRDSLYWNKIDNSSKERWVREYKEIENQIDSVINHFNKRYEENKLENYVSIELSNVRTDYYSYSNGVKDVNFGFKLTPLKETIQQIVFYYSLTPKINDDEDDDSLFGNLLKDRNGCRSMSPFSKPTTRYWKVEYSKENEFGGKTKDEVLRDYNLEIEIDKIRVNNTNLSNDDSKLPYSIESYNEYKEKEFDFMTELYQKDISTEFLNIEYLPLSDFQRKISDSIVNRNPSFKKINDLYTKYYERNR